MDSNIALDQITLGGGFPLPIYSPSGTLSGTAGSVQISLTAGVGYNRKILNIIESLGDTTGFSGSINARLLPVPTPSTVSLLAVSGLIAVRRRR